MPIYRTSGHLTDYIEMENVQKAHDYLKLDHSLQPLNMQQYLDAPLDGVIELLEWDLKSNGYDYTVTAFAARELTTDELKLLSENVSGQNSDGLGEGFEQQDFAWSDEGGEDESCMECGGEGVRDDDQGECMACEGEGIIYADQDAGHMISFDWEKNELPWVRVS